MTNNTLVEPDMEKNEMNKKEELQYMFLCPHASVVSRSIIMVILYQKGRQD